MLPTTPISLSMQILHVRCSFNRRFSLSRSLASVLMAAPRRLCDCGKLRGAEEPDSPFPPNGALLLCCNTAAAGG